MGRLKKKRSSWGEKALSVLAILSFAAGILFLSPNLTGNVVGGVASDVSGWLGIGLVFVGIGLLYFVRKIYAF